MIRIEFNKRYFACNRLEAIKAAQLEKIEAIAARILKNNLPAFNELAM